MQRLFTVFVGLLDNELKELSQSKNVKRLKLEILSNLPFTAIKKDIQVYLELICDII